MTAYRGYTFYPLNTWKANPPPHLTSSYPEPSPTSHVLLRIAHPILEWLLGTPGREIHDSSDIGLPQAVADEWHWVGTRARGQI